MPSPSVLSSVAWVERDSSRTTGAASISPAPNRSIRNISGVTLIRKGFIFPPHLVCPTNAMISDLECRDRRDRYCKLWMRLVQCCQRSASMMTVIHRDLWRYKDRCFVGLISLTVFFSILFPRLVSAISFLSSFLFKDIVVLRTRRISSVSSQLAYSLFHDYEAPLS